jgi:hypothetical protein
MAKNPEKSHSTHFWETVGKAAAVVTAVAVGIELIND